MTSSTFEGASSSVSHKEPEFIQVRGAKEHNLKGVDLDLPKKSFIVITGVSGSGKSSLAFDTIFAEGQRRYVESLSSYARQFIGQMRKPKYETLRGLSPTISIDQKSASRNPRSTVGTITEIYDYLRVLFARMGVQHCIECGKPVGRGHAQAVVDQLMALPEKTKFLLLAPLVENRKGEHRELFRDLAVSGYARVRVDGVVTPIEQVSALSKNKKHTIEVVVDRLAVGATKEFRARLTDSVEQALREGSGRVVVHIPGQPDRTMSESLTCCGHAYPTLEPSLFSFNSPQGMCPECNGIGTRLSMDPQKIISDPSLNLRQGALKPWKNLFDKKGRLKKSWGGNQVRAMVEQWGIDLDAPWEKMKKPHRDLLLHGAKGKKLKVLWDSEKVKGEINFDWEGMMNTLLRRYRQTQSEGQKKYYQEFMSEQPCSTCNGLRLRPEVLGVHIDGRSIVDVTEMTIEEAHQFFSELPLQGNQELIGAELIKEVVSRLGFLKNVGLDYLSLSRKGPTLSGGESQRIRLASQVGSELSGVLYVLDEPSIGLHQRDNRRLLKTLFHLRDMGNTLIVIEHDQETMEAADWLVDIGPGAGVHGGEIVAQGVPAQIVTTESASLTCRYLSGAVSIPVPSRRTPLPPKRGGWITIKKPTQNNLKGMNIKLPLGLFVAVTGVSGAGKSTLVNQILYPALARHLYKSNVVPGAHEGVSGLENIDKVINIDQSPIGRTPRSNPATYTKVFDLIRDFYSQLPEAKVRGYTKGRFSFNVKGGRCEECRGDGYIKVEMHFLADVYVPCKACRGQRFNDATLEVKHKGHSIAQVLSLSVERARELFAAQPKIRAILDTLMQVGMGYISLGQSALTLSGGEAQRIKLARELAKRDTGRTLYILDEPTTGLHFHDIGMLLEVLGRLRDHGNTVVVIEHNLDVIKTADWVIDLGPEGGEGGGQVVAQGTPEEVAATPKSYTGQYLKRSLNME